MDRPAGIGGSFWRAITVFRIASLCYAALLVTTGCVLAAQYAEAAVGMPPVRCRYAVGDRDLGRRAGAGRRRRRPADTYVAGRQPPSSRSNRSPRCFFTRLPAILTLAP